MVDGVEAKLLLDERVNVDSSDCYVIEKPASYVRYYQDVSSNVSNSSIHFSIVPPSAGVCVSKRILVEMDAILRLNVSNGTGGNARFHPTSDIGGVTHYNAGITALRSFPLHSILESISMTLNQTTITMNPSEIIHALGRTGFTKEWMDDQPAPTQPDTTCDYTLPYSAAGAVFGSTDARNPFNAMTANGAQACRGAWRPLPIVTAQLDNWNPEIADGAAGDVYYRFRWTEALMLSPLLFKRLWQEQPAFSGLTNIDITLNLGDLSRMFCLALPTDWTLNSAAASIDGTTITTPGGGVGPARQAPQAHLCYLTPSVIQELPRVRHFPYYEVNRYPSPASGPVAAFASNAHSLNNIQLSSVPKRVLVFLKRQRRDETIETSDVFARIDGIRVNFNNKNALLGSANAYDLWRMSRRNGLNATWSEYNEYLLSGGPVVIDFGRDISLDADEAVGSFGQFQLQLDVEYTNTCEQTVTFEPYLVVISEGVFTVQDTSTFLSVGSVLPRNILNAESLSALDRLSLADVYDYNGGSFWGSVKRIAKKAWSGLKKGARYLSEHPEMIKKAADIGRKYLPEPFSGAIGVAENVATRLAPMMHGKGLQSGRGGYVTGGRQMRRASLRSRM